MADALALEQHLDACAACHSAYAEQSSIKSLVRSHAGYARAPAELKSRIAGSFSPWKLKPASSRRRGALWFGTGAAAASLCFAIVSTYDYRDSALAAAPLDQEVVYSHIRSLQSDHLLDVASSDRHTVKPWFNGKLDFSPPVVDLAADGFQLAGGRLDFFAGHPVAALIYLHNHHPINLYVWPETGHDSPLHIREERGYGLARWSATGMQYVAVSDLAPEELWVFAARLGANAKTLGAEMPSTKPRTKPNN